ncbi:GNAT family N-acetyltransferase [Flavobacterium sp. ANB]|uniref:GNAT family N-acetyltransferase n=1 Tax=unclassified Flavobacterium TaxID=196869 RepID=UPI0012B97F89|nr:MULTISPECIES: GNAT family N-acetyltransferase [unclassified Flavobacterium]MBF4518238.1 GNAT family N-acetyltransferase [Flavobacterium sp. ANB]MTD71064.1 GNAT family N-acetyltransferase [Flavobacterium sp. LC2016-13]
MNNPEFNLQPEILENDITKLIPLQENHFDELYKAGSDPLIWEQYPIKDRYKLELFKPFFEAAIESKGAFLILDKQTNEVMGTSRFYGYDAEKSSVGIGYTFISRKFWGGPYNKSVKDLMINYAFEHVNSVLFHVAHDNYRSQKAVLKLGAEKVNEVIFNINGLDVLHFEYELKKL